MWPGAVDGLREIKRSTRPQPLLRTPHQGTRPVYMMNYFCVQVLRPLCWTGLLHRHSGTNRYSTADAKFTKTPLWRAALELGTDAMVRQSAQD